MKHPEACTQCGTCVSVCPVEKVGGHAFVTFLADPEATDYSAWLCTSCHRCEESCPEGVPIYALIMEQRRHEQPPAGYAAAIEAVLACGESLQVSQEDLNQMRATWELERVTLPPPGLVRKLLSGK
ncbi:MAG: 4Fe-4S binding protein [Anaerolineae bacterium]|nr:4Fe-4S binding protein [Anaerolineae bacterium]